MIRFRGGIGHTLHDSGDQVGAGNMLEDDRHAAFLQHPVNAVAYGLWVGDAAEHVDDDCRVHPT